MEIFINESSLHSQYKSSEEFSQAISIMIEGLNSLKDIKSQMFNSNWLFYMSTVNDSSFGTFLKTNSDLSNRFKDALQKNNIKRWESTKIQLDDISYEYNSESYNGYSIAEFTERKFQNSYTRGFLLNFPDSKFLNNPFITILRNKSDNIILDCNYDLETINGWLISNQIIDGTKPYNEKSKNPPLDQQTVLFNSEIFERTNYPKNNGRTVYRRIGTNELWTVDGAIKHSTQKAHIEIFDENTAKHLGTSLINKIELDISFKKGERTINLG